MAESRCTCACCGLAMPDSGTRRNIHSHGHVEIIDSLVYVISKANSVPTTIVEEKIKDCKHVCRSCLTLLLAFRKKEGELISKAMNSPLKSEVSTCTSSTPHRRKRSSSMSMGPAPKRRALFSGDSSSPPVAVSSSIDRILIESLNALFIDSSWICSSTHLSNIISIKQENGQNFGKREKDIYYKTVV